jgi:hypothetical protein
MHESHHARTATEMSLSPRTVVRSLTPDELTASLRQSSLRVRRVVAMTLFAFKISRALDSGWGNACSESRKMD